MLIRLSRRAAICQSVAEVQLTGVAPLGAVSHRFNFFNYSITYKQMLHFKQQKERRHQEENTKYVSRGAQLIKQRWVGHVSQTRSQLLGACNNDMGPRERIKKTRHTRNGMDERHEETTYGPDQRETGTTGRNNARCVEQHAKLLFHPNSSARIA